MILKAFTVYDSVAECYLTPFFLHNENLALRQFGNACRSDEHQFGMNPEHYTH